jgi:hypothetical protein
MLRIMTGVSIHEMISCATHTEEVVRRARAFRRILEEGNHGVREEKEEEVSEEEEGRQEG